ncbi:MAG: DUF2332 family protein [Maritimibacter sp.]|nr:DUF2332 family protein [Maritimibacter sp.]
MKLEDAFIDQARSNRGLGSPFTAKVLTVMARKLTPGTPVVDRMLAWRGDISNRGASLPLRLLGGLHALVLTGECPTLAACYPPNACPSEEVLGRALDTAMERHADTLMRWLDTAPQTNEVRRSAVLIAGAHWLAAKFGLADFVVSELGAAAGLNLMWDRFRLDLAWGVLGPRGATVRLDPEWIGPAPPEGPNGKPVRIVDARGVDVAPLDPHDPADALRLTSYIWPDQPWRIERARAAIDMCDVTVDKADAGEWLERRLATPRPGAIHLVTHTVAWQYFPEETRARCLRAMERAGARATAEAPLARLSMEGDERKGEGAPIELTIWPGNHHLNLGRADFHGRWVDWDAPSEHSPRKKKEKP